MASVEASIVHGRLLRLDGRVITLASSGLSFHVTTKRARYSPGQFVTPTFFFQSEILSGVVHIGVIELCGRACNQRRIRIWPRLLDLGS
jgi:hypothetical protein